MRLRGYGVRIGMRGVMGSWSWLRDWDGGSEDVVLEGWNGSRGVGGL